MSRNDAMLTEERAKEHIKQARKKVQDATSIEDGIRIALNDAIVRLQEAANHGATAQDVVDVLKSIDPVEVADDLLMKTKHAKK